MGPGRHPDDVVEQVDAASLPGWDAPDYGIAQGYGDRWLDENRSLALSVPSVVTRVDRNIILNPVNPRFVQVAVAREQRVVLNPRLFAWEPPPPIRA